MDPSGSWEHVPHLVGSSGARWARFLQDSPSLRWGWLRCRSWQVRAGLSWVPRGKRMVSISCRSELREPKISSMPSLPTRNSVPVLSDAGAPRSSSGSSWLPSMERLDLGLLWMGRGWITSPGGPWGSRVAKVGTVQGGGAKCAGEILTGGPGGPGMPFSPFGPAPP